MKRPTFIITALILFTTCGYLQAKTQNTSLSRSENEEHKGVSFKVNDVEIAKTLLKVDSARQVFENKIGKKILFFPEEHASLGLVNCLNNGLIQTIQECYDNHRPLILTPDIIWLAICQGVSIHMNEHYDSLKNVVFIEGKPDKIIIRNDSLEYSAKHWKNLIGSFSTETKKYTNDDFYSFFVSEFTTTTAIDQTAYQITLLESYKKAFEYIGETGCGIPSITLEGNKADWQTILKKLDMLNKIGLSNWAENLKPIIQEFINASDGKYKKEFWENIYKNASEYNAFYVSGWIIKFFPYIKSLESDGIYDVKRGETKVGENFKPNKFFEGDNYLLSTLSTDNFPSGLAKIPITWINKTSGLTKKMEVYAGFFAIKQYEDKSLKPLVSWAICEEYAKNPEHKLTKNNSISLKHSPAYWSPHFAANVTDSAVYDIKRFKTHKNSIAYLKQMLVDSLQSNLVFQSLKYVNDTIQVTVLSNGTIGEVSMTHCKNDQIVRYIAGLLKGLPEKWFPALAHPTAVLDLTDFPEEENKIKVRVNSMVKIELKVSN